MSLETAQFIHQLNASNPSGADRLKEGDDHIRLLKAALKNTFPGLTGPLDPAVTHDFLNGLSKALVPAGVITLWHGAEKDVPTGWAICDGREVPKSGGGTLKTPDLSGRVPMGVSADYVLLSTAGAKSKTITTEAGGGHTHTAETSEAGSHDHGAKTGGTALTVDQIPSHRHRLVVDAKTRTRLSGDNFMALQGEIGNDSQYEASTATGEPNVGLSGATGGGQAHDHSITAGGAHKHNVSVSTVEGHSHKATIELLQPSLALYFIIKV